MIKLAQLTFNPFGENTYILYDQTGECVIVDAGCASRHEEQALEAFVEKNRLKPVLALNTHGHVDHVCGVGFVTHRWGIPFAAHAKEISILEVVPNYASDMGFSVETVPKIDIDLAENMEIKLGESTLQIIETPGHTPGHVAVYIPETQTLLTGDLLFKESIGRTDLPGGHYPTLMASILDRVLPLGSDVHIFPGHGPQSTLAHESMYNPFLVEALRGDINCRTL